MERTDLIIDYNREQFIIELKLWRGEKRHREGEMQLADYLDHYHMTKGCNSVQRDTYKKTK